MTKISNCGAQNGYDAGFIIRNSGDTLKGQCSLPKAVTVTEVKFKDASGEITSFHPSEITGFGYNTGSYFMSVTERNEFMEVHVNGRIKLLGSGTDFFAYASDKLYPLINTTVEIERNGQPYLKDNKEYVRTLGTLFSDCPKIQPKLAQAELRRYSLVRIFKLYYECMGEVSKTVTKMKQPIIMGFGVSVYQGNNSLSQLMTEYPLKLDNISGTPVENLTDMVKLNDIKQYNALTYGVAFNFMNPRISRHFGFSAEVMYNQFKMSSSNIYYSYAQFVRTNYTSFSFHSIHLHFMAQYYVLPEDKRINPFINAGFGIGFYANSTGSLTGVNYISNGTDYTDRTITDPVKTFRFAYTLLAGAGIKVKYTSKIQGQFTFRYETGPGPFNFTAASIGPSLPSHQDTYYFGTSLFYVIGDTKTQ